MLLCLQPVLGCLVKPLPFQLFMPGPNDVTPQMNFHSPCPNILWCQKGDVKNAFPHLGAWIVPCMAGLSLHLSLSPKIHRAPLSAPYHAL